ncbi:RidA family protein [Negadavirga shengliensis]|uniref:RidA family protein n=1 Tax=Negadavirga shengliensis TaxID=1389218 RepID=A0ABV9T0M8_9BACT
MENSSAESRLKSLGLTLPPAPPPGGVYKPLLIVGTQLYLSGHGPVLNDGSLMSGKVGIDLDKKEGKQAARQVGLTMLSTIRTQLGSLNKIRRVVKILGMVNSSLDFGEHPYVINGCSELFADIWGEENGIGTRSAVGFGSLPGNIPVEIEAMFELYP